MVTLVWQIRELCRRFRCDRRGNITITFALALLPMVGFVGAAVDYSHASSVKAAMQAAADSTALMLSKVAASETTASLQTKATGYFTALFTRPEATGVIVAATYTTSNGSQVIVNASSSVKASFMGLLGISTMKVAVDSQVRWGNTKLRVALALDTTGSMYDDGKIEALKTATKSLLDKLKAAATTNGDVYVSLIPFSKDVNVGNSNYNASWIDWTDWEDKNGSCSKGSDINSRSECLSQNGNPKWTPNNHSSWNGCVTDRGGTNGPSGSNYDTNVSMPSIGNAATLFPAEQYGSCSQKITPLNYDWTNMKTLVDALYPAGSTNQGIGIAHGWMSLTGGGPYPTPPPEDPNYKYTKAIILMSDGLNTQNRWYSDQASIDAREAMTCANAKAAGIVIYTVQVNTGGDPTQAVMKNCASGADKFTEIKAANQLVSTFNSIGSALSNLRIAQ